MPCPPAGDLPVPGIKPRSPVLQEDSSPSEPQGKSKNTGVLQGNFLTQELSWGLLHCRWILYQLSYQGSPHSRVIFNFDFPHVVTLVRPSRDSLSLYALDLSHRPTFQALKSSPRLHIHSLRWSDFDSCMYSGGNSGLGGRYHTQCCFVALRDFLVNIRDTFGYKPKQVI